MKIENNTTKILTASSVTTYESGKLQFGGKEWNIIAARVQFLTQISQY